LPCRLFWIVKYKSNLRSLLKDKISAVYVAVKAAYRQRI
jgi:hypothetical protein